MNDMTIGLTGDIVSAFVSNNSMPAAELPSLIGSVYAAINGLNSAIPAEAFDAQPIIPVRKSVTSDAVICLACGAKQKTLKSHLRGTHGWTPDEYRTRFKLASDHPLVAPNYTARRKEIAVKNGLGRKAGG